MPDRGSVSNSYMYVTEEAERFLLYTDLPGVKAQDLTVELTNRGILRIHGERKSKMRSGAAVAAAEPVKFDRQFMIDEKLLDSSNITATFSDGSLEIVAPKRQPSNEPRHVAVVAGTAPSSTEGNNNNNNTGDHVRSFTVDVPGVKVEALMVQIDDDGKLVIAGERERAGQTVTVHRAFALDTDVVDTEKMEAFLEDGILTLRLPVKAPRLGKSIQVNGASNEETVVHENKSNDEDDHDAKDAEEEFHDVQAEETESHNGGISVEEPAEDGNADVISKAATIDDEKAESELEFEVVPETVTEDDE